MKLIVIAKHINAEISEKDSNVEILHISSFDSMDKNSITFLADDKLKEDAEKSSACAIIVKKGTLVKDKINLEVDEPYLCYAKVAQLFEERLPVFGSIIHPSAIIDQSAELDSTVSVGPGTVIGRECVIGKNSIICANCVIEKNSEIGANCRIDSGVIIRRNSEIHNRVIIQAGTVIGSEGFGNASEDGKFVRIPCFGNVIIEDDVEIGACVTIDRGNFEPTIIRKGARIDNLVMIAHNVEVGENSAMAAQVGISGSTKLGKGVLLGGQAGLVGHITIGDNAFIGAKAGISKDVQPGAKVTGYPARDFMKMRRIEAAQLYLPEMKREVKRLRKELDSIKNKKNDSQ